MEFQREMMFDDDMMLAFTPAIIIALTDAVTDTANIVKCCYKEGESRVRNQNYFEEVVPRYSLDDFFMHFRMSRATLQILVDQVAPCFEHGFMRPEKQLAFTVWMLAKPESFRACCDRFGIPNSMGHTVFHKICQALANMLEKIVCWPTPERTATTEVAGLVFKKTKFPGAIGTIDGCHIPIKAPAHNGNDYYNRKDFHSVILQGTCDHQMKFIDILIGMPGRCHDARVFRVSPLFKKITTENLIPHDKHILGDTAYPLSINVMVPFRDNGHLTRAQNRYNELLSSCRSKVEQAFGCLKGRWRRLKYLDMNVENINNVIAAACVLHNFTLTNETYVEAEDVTNLELRHEDGIVVDGPEIHETGATQKRLHIMNQLYT